MMFNMFNKNTHVEVKSIRGRADIVVFGKKSVFVLEVKINSTPEDALQQIEDKGYSIAYQDRINGRKVVKCGVNISSKERNINGWKIC